MKLKIKANAYLKGLIIVSKPHLWLGWAEKHARFFANTISLSRWIAAQDKAVFNDFYTSKRDNTKRELLYQHVVDTYELNKAPFQYLEFGVSEGHSFKWWLSHIDNQATTFEGFDTFEGLPEDWGFFSKGAMSSSVPQVSDTRARFHKGLFQDTLYPFIKHGNVKTDCRKVIHMDADIFSATLFTLTTLAPLVNKGDIIFFDEFNVPNHEYSAYKIFTESFYIKLRTIGSVNNYYQTAFIVE